MEMIAYSKSSRSILCTSRLPLARQKTNSYYPLDLCIFLVGNLILSKRFKVCINMNHVFLLYALFSKINSLGYKESFMNSCFITANI